MVNKRRKILLIDDDNSSRQQGRAILKDMYEVYPLPSAHKMFEVLQVITPDLILLDIHMPVIDGFETIKRLKSDPNYAKIPVIFLTASNDKESVLKGSSLGAAGFITKPFSSDNLYHHIENCLNPPVKKEPAADVAKNSEVFWEEFSKVAAPETAPQEARVRTDKPIILAIDDAPDVLKTIHSVLKDSYKVYTLPKPEKLVDFLRKTKPDLFLLDYQMPEMSGFELVPLIRDFPEHEETPIIFLTSEGTLVHLTAAVGLGACDFIVKPVTMEVLREKVAHHLPD